MKERKGKNQKWRSTRKDYRMYHFTGKETAKYLLEGAAVCAVADYLFYQSLPVLLFMLPIPVLFLKMQRKKCTARQQRELNYQFRDALTAMNVAVQAGYSAENAVRASVKDLGRLYEKGSDILDEFRYIESQLRLSVPVEELFLDLGKRSGVEDIENFAAVFYTAKRTGGDMTQVIQKVARMLSDKIEVKKEIEATLAAKKSEQMVMSIMPAGIICYLKLTSPGFLDVLYGNPFGICAMTVCMVIYGLLLAGCEDCRHRSVGEDNVDTYFDIYGDPWGVSGRKNGAAASGSRKSGRKETVYTDSAYRKYHRYAPDISKWRR